MNWSLTGWNKTNTNFYHLSQFVKYLVDLLAIREADVGLAHQAPHFLPDVIFAHLHENKDKPQRLRYSQGNKNLCILTNSFTVLWMNWQKALHTFIISMYAIMLCSRVAKSLSSSSSRRLRSCSPSDRYLCRHATQKNLFTVHNEFHGVDMKTVMQQCKNQDQEREKKAYEN